MSQRCVACLVLIFSTAACEQRTAESPASAVPRVAPATSPTELKTSSFIDKLRELTRKFGSGLTPDDAAAIFGGSAQRVSESYWSVSIDAASKLIMQAERRDARVSRVDVHLSLEFGLKFGQLFAIYGDKFEAIEQLKSGSHVFFESREPRARVAVQLFSRTATPDSPVLRVSLLAAVQH